MQASRFVRLAGDAPSFSLTTLDLSAELVHGETYWCARHAPQLRPPQRHAPSARLNACDPALPLACRNRRPIVLDADEDEHQPP